MNSDAQLRAEIVKRDGLGCQWPTCEKTKKLQVHHIIPDAFGGLPILSNTCLLCDIHHGLVHKFLRMPAPKEGRKLKPEYVAAWAAMRSILRAGPNGLFTGQYDNEPAVNGKRIKETD